MAILEIKASKATPQKVIEYITNPEKAALTFVGHMDRGEDLAKQMLETADMWGKNQNEDDRKYYHNKISFAVEDWNRNGGPLSEEEAAEFGKEFVREFFAEYETVGAVHVDREHLHLHIICNSVNFKTGEKIHMSDAEIRRLKDRVQEMSREKGLYELDWRQATADKREKQKNGELQPEEFEVLTFAEKGIREREGMPVAIRELSAQEKPSKVSWKDELRIIIDYAADNCTTLKEFNETLNHYGVTTPRNTATTISYLHPGRDKAVRGDTLGGGYTKAAIMEAIEYNRLHLEINNIEDKELPTLEFLIREANARKEAEAEKAERDREFWRRYNSIRNDTWTAFIEGQRREFDKIKDARERSYQLYLHNSKELERKPTEDDLYEYFVNGKEIKTKRRMLSHEQLEENGYFDKKIEIEEEMSTHRQQLDTLREYQNIAKQHQQIFRNLMAAGANQDTIEIALARLEEAERLLKKYAAEPDYDIDNRRLKAAKFSLEQAQKKTEYQLKKLAEEKSVLMDIADKEYTEFKETGEANRYDIESALRMEAKREAMEYGAK